MARVFPEDSPWLDKENVPESLEKIERYLRYMQERIEHDSYSKSIYDQRQNEEIALVVKRSGTSVEINEDAIQTAAGVAELSSSITQTASKIESIVQSVGADGTVTAASIVQAVNNAGSTVKISADHITLSGDVVMRSNLTDGSTQISGSNITTGQITASVIDTANLYVNGQNINGAVAKANALDDTIAGFAAQMMGYVKAATQTATSSAGGLDIGGSAGVKLYAASNTLNVVAKTGGASISFTPEGATHTKYGTATTIKSFVTVDTGSALYGIGLEGSTPTNGFVRLND